MTKSNYNNAEKAERCFFCPTRHDLEEHHIVPERFGGEDQPRNIVTVCERCHNKLERLYDKRFYEHFGIEDETGERKAHRVCEYPPCSEYADKAFRVEGVKTTATVFKCSEHAGMHEDKDTERTVWTR